MRVNDNSPELIDYSKKLDTKLRNQTIKKEAEIENVKQIYDKKIESAKIEGDNRYIESLKRNDNLLVGAAKDYEEKLNSYKEGLQKTQKTVEQEEAALKQNQANKLLNSEDQFRNAILDHNSNSLNQIKEVHHQSQENLRELTDTARSEKNHVENATRTEINSLASNYNQKGIDTERNFKENFNNNLQKHQEELNLQKVELKKMLDTNSAKGNLQVQEKTRVQTDELNYLEKHQKDLITQKQNDFKIRYENLVKEHDAILGELKGHFDADVQKMAMQTASQKKTIANRIDDRFYRIETLSPTVREGEKDYEVSLAIPEHEKDNVHLSAQGRSVKMTLTRKFSDSIEDSDGNIDKSTRSELFSKDFTSKDILNPKLISQKYENGVLTYKIQKL